MKVFVEQLLVLPSSAKILNQKNMQARFTEDLLLSNQVSHSVACLELILPGDCTIIEDYSRKRGAVYCAINESHG